MYRVLQPFSWGQNVYSRNFESLEYNGVQSAGLTLLPSMTEVRPE